MWAPRWQRSNQRAALATHKKTAETVCPSGSRSVIAESKESHKVAVVRALQLAESRAHFEYEKEGSSLSSENDLQFIRCAFVERISFSLYNDMLYSSIINFIRLLSWLEHKTVFSLLSRNSSLLCVFAYQSFANFGFVQRFPKLAICWWIESSYICKKRAKVSVKLFMENLSHRERTLECFWFYPSKILLVFK